MEQSELNWIKATAYANCHMSLRRCPSGDCQEIAKTDGVQWFDMMRIDQAYNYRAVSDMLVTAGILRPDQLAALSNAGIEVVINLLPDSSEYSVKDERRIVERQGIEYWYLPVDFSDPKLEEYEQFKGKMRQSEGKKLLIHCAANYRVSAFYSRYAIESGSWSTAEADRFMLSIWQPSEYPGWTEWLDQVQRQF